mmetsp:Transcript_22422/g.22218  ORF Transcript_22422/g.22218 Transcript_22422/m.22218 type:complete len:129 (+) Transcript_22422:21-407(+)
MASLKRNTKAIFGKSRDVSTESLISSAPMDKRIRPTSQFEIFEYYSRRSSTWYNKKHFLRKSVQRFHKFTIIKEPIRDYYNIGQVIGSGRNSLVKEASSKVDPAMKFAIKVYKLKDCEDYSLSIFQEI